MNFFRGYLLIEIRGNALERFITQIIEKGIKLQETERINADYYRAKIYAADFNKLRPIVRRRLCTVKIQDKRGLVFLLARLKKRSLLVFGAILFLLVIWIASSFLWFISIEGLEKVPEARIYFILNKNNVKRGVLKNKLDLDYLEQVLLSEEPHLAWVNLKWQGTHLKIKVVEKKIVDRVEPGEVIAKKDGIIKKIIVLKGKAVVKEGDTVTAGQTLIVGVSNENEEKIAARGIVRAYTWYEATGEVQLECEQVIYTGESSKVISVKIGSKVLQIPPPPEYDKFTVTRKRKWIMKGRNYKFPLELIIEEYKEVNYFKYSREKETALFMARERALNKILDKLDSDSIILDVASEIKSIKNNKVTVRILMKTEENIARGPADKEGPGE